MVNQKEILKQDAPIEPNCFETDREEQWYKVGLYEGATVSPWHSVADGDFPLKAKNNNNRIEFSVEFLVQLDKNRLAFGRYDYTYKSWYVGLQRVYPTHWAEIPKLPTE